MTHGQICDSTQDGTRDAHKSQAQQACAESGYLGCAPEARLEAPPRCSHPTDQIMLIIRCEKWFRIAA